MNDFLDQISTLSPRRLALLAVKLKEQLDAARGVAEEPIAVIGIGCRFPGAGDPEAFWDMLENGREGIREVPASRWPVDDYFDPDPDAPGKMSTRKGGFLDEIDRFDPAFFGIAPREAIAMDPQQRLLLEVSWEALENAGVAPSNLMGSRTGVYVGICNSDYLQLMLGRGAATIDAYLASGNAQSVTSGRLSYVLGLQGPCMTIDTSCSASLVAIHAACQSLRLGESSLALAGGANIMCAPDTTIALSRSHMLADRWALQDLRRRRGWLLSRRGMRDGRTEAAFRRQARRRSDPGAGPRQRRQSGRQERRPHGAQWAGAGIGDPRRARGGASQGIGHRLCRGSRNRHLAWAIRSKSGRSAGSSATGAIQTGRC